MADTVGSLMERLELDQPINNLLNARMQRIEELERMRQEHMANIPLTPGNAGDAASRHTRREQIIRQASRQQRSTERRSFASNIQRTPVRSMSYENTPAAVSASTEQDTSLFRDMFDSTRQNLFGSRTSGNSTENLSSASLYGRRQSDTPLSVTRPSFQLGSDGSGSGSSTPRTSVRPQFDLTTGLAEAFAARASRVSSDTRIATREPRSLSVTRESRESARSTTTTEGTNTTTGSGLTRTSSLRQNRIRESRFRRRTIQGPSVDSSITQAVEQDRASQGRSTSPVVTVTSSATSKEEKVESRSDSRGGRELTHSSSFSSFNSRSDSYPSSYKRIVELYPEDSLPVLGLEDEKVIFIDNSGCIRWLNRHHQIVMSCRAKTALPEIVVKPGNKTLKNKPEQCAGYVAEMEDNTDSRYEKLKQLIKCSKIKDAKLENGDETDSIKDLSLFEIHQRGDYIEKDENDDIEEKYKTVSLYTPPRDKPDMENYFAGKVIVPIYDGIPNDQLPPELQAQDKVEEIEEKSVRATGMDINPYELARTTGIQYEFIQRSSSQQQVYSATNGDGSSTSGYSRSDREQSYVSEERNDENGSSRQFASDSRAQQSSVIVNDSVGSILRQRAEARRQQYLSESQNGNRRAEARNQQYLSESQTRRNGNSVVQSSSESNLDQFRSETRSNNGYSQTFTSQQHETSTFRQTSSTEIQSPNTEVDLVMERLFLMQGNDGPIDASHLDYEEMRMIQKALEENPSPPPSPEPYEEEYEYNEADFATETETSESAPLTIPQSFIPTSAGILDSISESSETVTASRISESFEPVTLMSRISETSEPASMSRISEASESMLDTRQSELEETSSSAVDNSNDNVMLDELSSPKTDTNNVFTSTVTSTESDLLMTTNVSASSVTSNVSSSSVIVTSSEQISTISEQTSSITSELTSIIPATRPTSLTGSSSSSSKSTFVTARQSILTHTKSLDESVLESRMPRYQRLPAADSADNRLPLPSIDWSPLEKANSPLSPKRFSFEEKKSSKESASASVSKSEPSTFTTSATTPKTIAKSSITPTKLNRPSVHSELTIEIPDHNSKPGKSPTGKSPSGRSESLKSASSPALVKSRNASRSGSEAPSPAGSESVTTVFEEFVQTIPRDVFEKWNNVNCDDL